MSTSYTPRHEPDWLDIPSKSPSFNSEVEVLDSFNHLDFNFNSPLDMTYQQITDGMFIPIVQNSDIAFPSPCTIVDASSALFAERDPNHPVSIDTDNSFNYFGDPIATSINLSILPHFADEDRIFDANSQIIHGTKTFGSPTLATNQVPQRVS
jgi:hypothetical protein